MAPTNRQTLAFRRLIAWDFKGGMGRDEVAHKHNISLESVDAAIRYFLNRKRKERA